MGYPFTLNRIFRVAHGHTTTIQVPAERYLRTRILNRSGFILGGDDVYGGQSEPGARWPFKLAGRDLIQSSRLALGKLKRKAQGAVRINICGHITLGALAQAVVAIHFGAVGR